MREVNDDIILIEDELKPKFSNAEALKLEEIQKKFLDSYYEHKDDMSVESWLSMEMAENLPECNKEEIVKTSHEIIDTIKIQEEKLETLKSEEAYGRSKESWFSKELKLATSHMSTQESIEYIKELDKAIKSANHSFEYTIHTQAGAGPLSQNPNLDGFIAEQYHAQTFNLNARAKGSPYRAKVLEPNGKGYAKNSVDIVIVDGKDKVVKRYQSKYCKNAEATAKAFEKGNYRGQQKLVPQDQLNELEQMGKKVTDVISAPDGTKSKALTKEQGKVLQDEAQSGNWNTLNWNEYQLKDLAIGIGKQAEKAAALGAIIGSGAEFVQKTWNHEEIKGEELVESAIVSGADFGVKAAVSGALKVASEKDYIKIIPKGTPAETIASVAHMAVENVKVFWEIGRKELTAEEGYEKIERLNITTIAGIMASSKGAVVGSIVGTVLGIGPTVGGFIGGTLAYMAGAKVGEKVVAGVQTVRKKARGLVDIFHQSVSEKVEGITNRIKGFIHSV